MSNYEIQFKPKALKDLDAIHTKDANRIISKIETLGNSLSGDVKRLTNFTPSYRLRVGDYRVLFELENQSIIVYRILHRREAYQ